MICVNRALQARSGTGTGPATSSWMNCRIASRPRCLPTMPMHRAKIHPAWTWPPAAVLVAARTRDAAAEDKNSAGAQTTTAAPSTALAAPTETPAVVTPTPPASSHSYCGGCGSGGICSHRLVLGCRRTGAKLNEAKILADRPANGPRRPRRVPNTVRRIMPPRKMTGAANVTGGRRQRGGVVPQQFRAGTGVDRVDVRDTRTRRPTCACAKPTPRARSSRLRPSNRTAQRTSGGKASIRNKAPAQRDLAWFAVQVPATSYLVVKLKITLNLAAVSGGRKSTPCNWWVRQREAGKTLAV